MSGFRVTYATLTADDDALNAAYDEAVDTVAAGFGALHPLYIGGAARPAGATFRTVSPVDRDVVIGEFGSATAGDVADAVGAAASAAASWAATDWRERADLLDRAADAISADSVALAAGMAWEVGKSRLEALGDVEESADLIRYYTHAMRSHDGFEQPMERLNPAEATSDVMRPYGVWGVISPFNYPMALVAGPAGAALAAGNTVVLKPSEIGSWCAHRFYDVLVDAGLPPGVVNLVTGPGETTGAALVADGRLGGITFTGSSAVGMEIIRSFSRDWPRPAICEMGGKNPVIVAASADLDLAVEGAARSAFGLGGQKCSAASRAFVDAEVVDEFCDRLGRRVAEIPSVSPLRRGGFLSPVVDEAAVARFEEAVAEARRVGTVHTGGTRMVDGELANGNFVAPTIVRVPSDSTLWSQELFAPILAVAAVESLDDAIDRANDTPYGLTAGLFAGDEAEVERFLERIEAGVVYVNRAAGATTGAWPGVQPFGGWKRSGTGGKAGGGPYYLQQYMREQSRTIVGG